MTKRILSLDLDGTIVSSDFGDKVWNEGIPCEYAKKYGFSFEEARRIVISEYNRIGDHNILWYDIEYWIDKFGLTIEPSRLLEKYEKYIRLAPGVKEELTRLREKFVLIVSSNASRIFLEKELSYTKIDYLFYRVFSATSDFRILKKERKFYEKVMDLLSVSPSEVIHVGDHPVFDFEVPKSLGIESYLVRKEEDVKEVLRKL